MTTDPHPLIGYATPSVARRVSCVTVDGVLTLRDPDLPLATYLAQEWLLVCCGVINLPAAAALVWFCANVTEPVEAAILAILTSLSLCNLFLTPSALWQRWRCRDTVTIERGTLKLSRRLGGRVTSTRAWQVREIDRARAVTDMHLYVSHFSIWVRFRDGTTARFLHCRGGAESRWIVQLLTDIAAAVGDNAESESPDDVPYAAALGSADLSAARLPPPKG